jgi:predicted transcriptional regulator
MAIVDNPALDRTFRALADETRRHLWTILGARPGATTSGLTVAFPLLSRWAVMKHLGVLRDAGLVQSLPDGRARRHYRIEAGMDGPRAWVEGASQRRGH